MEFIYILNWFHESYKTKKCLVKWTFSSYKLSFILLLFHEISIQNTRETTDLQIWWKTISQFFHKSDKGKHSGLARLKRKSASFDLFHDSSKGGRLEPSFS